MLKLLYHKILHYFHLWCEKIKIYADYNYLRKRGVDTEIGFVNLIGKPIISKAIGSTIKIGKGVVLVSDSKYNLAGINHPVILATYSADSEIIIEDGVGMSGTSVNCVNRCVIGGGTMIGVNVNVWDTDFHIVNPSIRKNQRTIHEASSDQILIGENVWIGANSIILKGVRIGDNSVIGAMSLVNKDVNPSSLYAGVPAKMIKSI